MIIGDLFYDDLICRMYAFDGQYFTDLTTNLRVNVKPLLPTTIEKHAFFTLDDVECNGASFIVLNDFYNNYNLKTHHSWKGFETFYEEYLHKTDADKAYDAKCHFLIKEGYQRSGHIFYSFPLFHNSDIFESFLKEHFEFTYLADELWVKCTENQVINTTGFFNLPFNPVLEKILYAAVTTGTPEILVKNL